MQVLGPYGPHGSPYGTPWLPGGPSLLLRGLYVGVRGTPERDMLLLGAEEGLGRPEFVMRRRRCVRLLAIMDRPHARTHVRGNNWKYLGLRGNWDGWTWGMGERDGWGREGWA